MINFRVFWGWTARILPVPLAAGSGAVRCCGRQARPLRYAAVPCRASPMPEDQIVLVIVGVVALGVAAQWLAWRLRLPAIVLLAGSGLIVGPGLGWINPSAELGDLLRPVISLCVAIILFEGGLSLRLAELKEAPRGVQRLVYLGAPFGWAAATLCAHYIGGLDWAVSLVFGAIMW